VLHCYNNTVLITSKWFLCHSSKCAVLYSGLLEMSNDYCTKNGMLHKNVPYLNDLALTFSCCASFVHYLIIVNVTWLHFGQSTEHLVVGHMTTTV